MHISSLGIVLRLAVALAAGLALTTAGVASADDGYDLDYEKLPPSHPDCPVPQDGPGVTPDGERCVPPGPSEAQIRYNKASVAWFQALQDYEAGTGS